MKRKTILVLAVVPFLFISASEVHAIMLYNDGNVHEINSNINDFVHVEDGPMGNATTVNLVSGAEIYYLDAHYKSQINIYDAIFAFSGGGSYP